MSRYGPHRPEDAPVAQPNPDRRIPDLIAVPASILRQRQRINELAHTAGLPELEDWQHRYLEALGESGG